jgi:tRNA pseudouridine38-40 synthase
MNYYKATIQYDGTNYFGFQWQKDIPTIQNEINLSLAKLVKGKITTSGASRTDSGVHALEQIVKITSEEKIECPSFIKVFNEALPSQVRCLELAPCEGSFNPIRFSLSKEYRYLFTNTLGTRGLEERFIANYPYDLNLALMQKCARMIVGQHDFKNFCSAGSNVKTTVREVLECDLDEINPHLILGNSDLFSLSKDVQSCYQLKISGQGFLKQMVRHLMSSLWLVGRGKISPDEFQDLLNGNPKTRRLWKVSTPRGLYLYRFGREICPSQ